MVTVRSTIKRAIKLKRRNDKGAEEPTHPRSLIIAFIFCYLESKSFKLAGWLLSRSDVYGVGGAASHELKS